ERDRLGGFAVEAGEQPQAVVGVRTLRHRERGQVPQAELAATLGTEIAAALLDQERTALLFLCRASAADSAEAEGQPERSRAGQGVPEDLVPRDAQGVARAQPHPGAYID